MDNKRIAAATSIASLVMTIVSSSCLKAQSQASPSTLLQQGIFAEETEGDLEAAIEIYKSIAKETERHQSIAAQAYLRLGLCYKRLGRSDEAESTFRRLIRRFPEQTAQVTKALQELPPSEPSAGPKRIREIILPKTKDVWATTSLSDNGELVALTEGKGLHVYNTRLGTTQVISESAPLWYGGCALFSEDASQVFYATGYKPSQIFISSTTNPNPKEILKDDDRHWVTLHDWSHTHDSIAAVRSDFDNSAISLIKIDPPQIIDVLELRKNPVSKIRFHPIEPLMVFEKEVSTTKREIWTLDLRDKSTQEVNCYRVQQLVGWSPNGREIIYIGDGSGDSALYAINPKTAAPPRLIDNHLGTLSSCQITPNGFHYVLRNQQSLNVYTAEVDFSTGAILKSPMPFTERFAGYNTRPHWSQDGKRLAYHIERPNDLRLALTDSKNQNTNLISVTELTRNSFIKVLFPPHSDRLILEAWGENPEIVWFDPQAVQKSPLVPSKLDRTTGLQEINSDPHLSPDGKSLFYSKHIITRDDSQQEQRQIIQRNFNTGEESIILDFTGYTSRSAPFFDWSLAHPVDS